MPGTLIGIVLIQGRGCAEYIYFGGRSIAALRTGPVPERAPGLSTVIHDFKRNNPAGSVSVIVEIISLSFVITAAVVGQAIITESEHVAVRRR